MRQIVRRNGKLSFDLNGKHIPGPFTIQARREILTRLIDVQEKFGDQLIREEELKLIYGHWAEELQAQGGLADV